ncbi:MAG TPA: MFS transporter [Actinophytocola sp.]|uniref:MFS transporter n=1 Tax=Actinophytocola sp. TaxID=1872138 RepID=UPI002DDD74A1|nr:MFS transporter [Actinophytocola sp.]HEV2781805.1 MFS transporter [Actinophytocola sp.]
MSFTSGSRWSDVVLASGAAAISRCGDFMAATALVIALQERGAGSAAVAAVLIAAMVPPVVLARWTGRLADRVDSRLILVTAGLVQSAVCLALAYASGTVAIVALLAVLGCGLALTQPTLAALLPAMVRAEDLPRASAIQQTANSIGLLVAPALAGVLVGQFGLRLPLLVDALTYLAIAGAGLVIRTRRGARTGAAEGTVPAPAFRLRSDPLLWAMTVLIGAVIAVVAGVNVGEVFLVRGELHASATAFGLLSALWLASMMIGSWLTAGRRLSDGRLGIALLITITACCAVVAACAVVPAAGWLVPLFAIGGATNGGMSVAANVLLSRRVPAGARGRAFARYGAVGNAASVVGFLLGGALLAVLPVRVLFAGAGLLGVVVAAALAVPLVRAAIADRAPAAPPTPPPGSAAASPASPAPTSRSS